MRRLAAGGLVAGDVAADRGARRPGSRRRRPVPHRPGGHRRHLRALRARPLPGPVRGGVRASILIGPAIGGLITDTFGWHWVFFLNLPIGAFVFYVVWRYLPVVPPGRRQAAHRLPGCGAVHGCPGAHPRGPDQQGEPPIGRDPWVGGLIARRLASSWPSSCLVSRARRSPSCRSRCSGMRSFTVSVMARLPGRLRVLRDGRVPAALVPGRERLVGDRVRLPDPAAAGRPHLQRHRVSARSWHAPGAYRVLMFAAFLTMAVGLFVLTTLRADTPVPGAVGVDVRGRPRRRSHVCGLHPDRPERACRWSSWAPRPAT